jgi:hypothetical protein
VVPDRLAMRSMKASALAMPCPWARHLARKKRAASAPL